MSAVTARLKGAVDRPLPARSTAVWADRLRQVSEVLGRPVLLPPGAPVGRRGLEQALAGTLDLTDRGELWLALAAVSGQLPVDEAVTQVARAVELHGPRPLLDAIVATSTPDTMRRRVRIVQDTVVVDVHNTSRTDLATGIQRVARETARRWALADRCRLVAWIDHFHAVRELSPIERERIVGETTGVVTERTPEELRADQAARDAADLVVPWRATYVLPELVADRERNRRCLSLARHAPGRTGLIGFDTIPVSSGDTSAERVPDYFADHLSVARHVDRVTGISQAAAEEYGGWRTMLGAIGMTGPDIRPILLPAQAPAVSEEALVAAENRLRVGGLPVVLCVGTHEPRKNHGAVLHAAEVLWREGVEFSLTFVGGHSWRSERFRARLAELQELGRPVESLSSADDELLWGAYRVAHCTVFPSFNEGFGLPVAESLAAGTPVLTSGYGSMREIAADGGTVLVDPRDDASVTDGLRTLLTDADRYAELRAEAAARPVRTWDDYAEDVWQYLVEGR